MLSCFGLCAQDLLRFTDLLDETTEQINTILKSRSNNPSILRHAPIQEIQFRTETDELDFKRQEYTVRIRPTSTKVSTAQDKYFQLLQEQKSFEQQDLKRDFVEAAYQDWVNLYFASKELTRQKQLLVLLEDEEKVVNRLALLPGSSVKDLIEIQKDVYDLKLKVFKIEKFLAQSLSENIELDTSKMISIDVIAAEIKSGVFSLPPVNEQQENAFDMRLIEAETAIEIAEQKKYLDFIQLRYSGPHDDFFREKVSIGLGFQLPFASSNRLKMEELSMEKEQAVEEYEVQVRLHAIEVEKKKKEIELLLDELTYARQLFKSIRFRSQELVKRAAKEEGASPLPIIKNKMDLIEYDIDILELEESIYKEYIDLLILTGKLFEEPLKNYLTGS